ncbi:DUF4192 domain-containing protein [Streptomyces sp. Je 1-79]|uniref:DUF4192 domain-containing protein n=1 Tax=Streptomyces sp. Je 1-79 TaxID=2943847 RepID=UPI0021A4B44B|nr:DUF4192 domain-containing protein [Streptomyces sp. Je 1-79]MCT4352507.1 DUF4192 domain-containing protein [Streptomyces sp. Je 1-79]
MNTNPHEFRGTTETQQITLRGPAELADALPFMLGFHPSDSVVLVALHGELGRFGGRVRLGIPRSPKEWPSTAEHLAECLVDGCARRGTRPDGIVVFLCQDPPPGETGRHVMERLRPFAQRLRTACGALDIPVYEVLCISDGLHFSYCCPDTRCCPPDGTPLGLAGTSVMAASAAYAGIQVRGSLRDMEARLKPHASSCDEEQQRKALNEAAALIVPKIFDGPPGAGRTEVRETTLRLTREMLRRFDTPSVGAGAMEKTPGTGRARGAGTTEQDAADDAALGTDEAAALILGLQDRVTRDQAAEWMEGRDGAAALRLWRALARRCVAPFDEHAAAPLTLAGWVAWSTGDEPAARVALGLALDADPDYVFARLLHQACNEGLDPESLRTCLREERGSRAATAVETHTAACPVETRGPRPPAVDTVKVTKPVRPVRKGVRGAGTRPGKVAPRPPRGATVRRGGQRGTRSGR